MDFRENLFTVRVVKHQKEFSSKVVDGPHLLAFKRYLNNAL